MFEIHLLCLFEGEKICLEEFLVFFVWLVVLYIISIFSKRGEKKKSPPPPGTRDSFARGDEEKKINSPNFSLMSRHKGFAFPFLPRLNKGNGFSG